MGMHRRSIDTGPTAVLDLSGLTGPELASFLQILRSSVEHAAEVPQVSEAMWDEIARLRMEVRQAFITEFFRVG
jgi:hypothetical protein